MSSRGRDMAETMWRKNGVPTGVYVTQVLPSTDLEKWMKIQDSIR